MTTARLFPSRYKRKLLEWYVDGCSIREMKANMQKLRQTVRGRSIFKKDYSIYWIHQNLQELKEYIEFWHFMHPEGIDNPANDEFYVVDVPIKALKYHKE